ncbi:nuclear receptor subfamily 2 group E member 1-like isoform X2 [Cimex lectularius]|nr:nuclear receptor subfamily 2 group E member 1-like isoform X2 [Cimex lectularius]XP_024080798.1 nuclear receptor subfamily 2 group E member 1-like isoform X2 [Cimex lectularius]
MQEEGKEAYCKVCGDKASGKHYGVASCDGCRGFFKRSIRRNLDYVCKEEGRCVVDVTRRNQCQACRFSKCLRVNMKKDAVQHERSPRSNSATPSLSFVYQQFLPYPRAYLHPASIPGLQYMGCYMRSECNENEVSSSQESTESRLEPSVSLLSEDIYSTSSRLLSLTVQCVRAIPSFQQLSPQDRDSLLEDSWKDLFILTLAQWSLPIEQEKLIRDTGIDDASRLDELRKDLKVVSYAIARLTQLRADHTEFACLKALVLFNPESVRKEEVEVLQEQTHVMLAEYSGVRSAKLLLLLLNTSRTSLKNILLLFFNRHAPVRLEGLLASK